MTIYTTASIETGTRTLNVLVTIDRDRYDLPTDDAAATEYIINDWGEFELLDDANNAKAEANLQKQGTTIDDYITEHGATFCEYYESFNTLAEVE